MSNDKFDPVLLPILKNVIPDIIASEILGVQPMTANMINPFTKKWEKIGMDMPTDKWVYNIRSQEIRTWIEEQPVHMWKYIDKFNKDTAIATLIGENYTFTEEMEAWFQLRWS
jgi:hypothetical protein